MDDQVYAITNLNGYASDMREAAAKSLSESTEDNLDEFITLNQIFSLVKEKCIGYDDENRPLLTEDINENIFEDIAVWIQNVCLSKLAAKDLVECAWSDEDNAMVFWAKEKPKNDSSKPKRTRKRKRKDSQ